MGLTGSLKAEVRRRVESCTVEFLGAHFLFTFPYNFPIGCIIWRSQGRPPKTWLITADIDTTAANIHFNTDGNLLKTFL